MVLPGLLSLLLIGPCVFQGAAVTAAPHQKSPGTVTKVTNLTLAREWLETYNTEGQVAFYDREIAAWDYESNLTDYNKRKSIDADLQKNLFKAEAVQNASQFAWQNFVDSDVGLHRKFKKISDIGTSALRDKKKLKHLSELVANMQSIYSKAQVCFTDGECLHLEPGLSELFTTNRSYETLLTAWNYWRDAAGKKIGPLYKEFVKLSNEASREAGYNDTGEYWRSAYEDKNLHTKLEDLYAQIKPLYQNLHIYVRRKLKEKYGADKFPSSGHIPAHLLGNMWAQQWNNILDLLLPYPDKQSVDVTPEMVKQGFTPKMMFKKSESFFTSLGLKPMPEEFWNGSIIERPKDGRQLTCHASAWDFYNAKDFRIKMCTRVNMEDLITIHHEMGHIQYFLQYKDQPLVYRDGANPGFHEAVGDTLALSVGTPTHLKKIGLLNTIQNDTETTVNYLMKVALEKIAFLPFGYLIDLYRWDVFDGTIPESEYNKHWWDLRCKYQGLAPPSLRSKDDFDPGAKFHVPANVPYIRYFVSFIVQFQFHEALCKKAGNKLPLYLCDIYQSKAAGKLLSDMLKMGSSKPWPEAMKAITGQSDMNSTSLTNYFQILTDWLEKENEKANDTDGWTEACPAPSPADVRPIEQEARAWLYDTYEERAEEMAYKDAIAEWNYNTNLTDENQAISVKEGLEFSAFAKEAAKNASHFNLTQIRDPDTQEQLRRIADLGTEALEDTDKLKTLKKLTSDMEGIYSKAQVCVDEKCMDIEPGLTRLMATSRNHNELEKAWVGWRDETGKKMRLLYQQFVNLSNEGVRDGGYNDTGEWWRSAYGDEDSFVEDLQQLFAQLRPLYQNLHAYVRAKLRKVYPQVVFPTSGHIPAHLLGNMWGQEWNNIYDILQPYADQPAIDITPELKKQKFTARRMFETAEEFYTSIGLKPMPQSFWNGSMITKPTDGRKVVCHASAWDFSNRHDYRIKMCTDINMEDLITIHHEMGHIQYYLQYKDLPITYRTGANPGFHEAVGDTLALSVSTPSHLHKIGLLKAVKTSHESQINYLLKIALEKIAFLPFGYLIDQWRWSVFSGETQPAQYNYKWWDLRCKYQGVSSPVPRKETDFDPGAKYHVASNTPYIRYFVSFVIQFQFHKALCEAAGRTGPLHQCDIYKSEKAGQRLGDMLKMGASKPWRDAMYRITGQRHMDAGPLMEYFQPLTEWLEKQNVNENIGWSRNCPPQPEPVTTPQKVTPCPPVTKPTGDATRLAFVLPVNIMCVLFAWMVSLR